ncbi:hypothetical protein ACCO45_010338 [Purpureocillium lilacinum]|uniref:Uncharacterized protein n=1 Tax=Purpureocillium lilacinum TaxID=33203 RepID=A0ACC4DEL1_PURLI
MRTRGAAPCPPCPPSKERGRGRLWPLQARAVDDLHVDGELAARVVEDQDADAAAARLERVVQARPQIGLVDDGQALLDVARLRHGDDAAVVHVQDAVLLEDGAEHRLHHDAGRRVGDEGRLLVQLLGEQVHAQVAVLARRRRRRDADHLARPALEHQEVAQPDVVARDRDRVGQVRVARVAGTGTGPVTVSRMSTSMWSWWWWWWPLGCTILSASL